MTIEGLSAVHSRVAQIERRFGIATAPAAGAGGDTFATVLRSAMGTATTVAADTAGTTRTETGAPAGLERFGNGQIPPGALMPIDGRHRLWGPAARAYQRMADTARTAGVDLRVTDSYRSYGEQVDVARRKGLYSEGGLAAQPGTSTHGWGKSVDLDATPETLAWLRRHAGRFGFVEDVPREPWHWTFRAESTPPGGGTTRVLPPPGG